MFNPVDILLDGHLVDGYLDCPYLWKCMYQNTLQNQTNPIKQGYGQYGFYNSTVLIEGFLGSLLLRYLLLLELYPAQYGKFQIF